MEALVWSSVMIPNTKLKFPHTFSLPRTPPSSSSSIINRPHFLKISDNSLSHSHLQLQILCAVSSDLPTQPGGKDNEQLQPNVSSPESLPLSQHDVEQNNLWVRFLGSCWWIIRKYLYKRSKTKEENLSSSQSTEKANDKPSQTGVQWTTMTPGSVGGTRAGLFRTPISGGVQSATSAHGLPRPALAVRNLMEQARFAHLCTLMSRMHHRREGYPFGSLVDFAPDSMGHPIFSFSPLAIHTRNLLADPRCTLVVQIPGWSGLSNARVTIFGDVYPLPEDQQEWAHKQYIAKHQQGPSQQWGNFYYFRMQNISDIYFIGGFGTVAWVDVKEFETVQPDKIAVDGGEQNLKELNAIFSKPLKQLLSNETEVDDAALISIDSKGIDIRVRQGAQFNIQRLAFDEGQGVETLEEAKAALRQLIHRGKVYNLQQ